MGKASFFTTLKGYLACSLEVLKIPLGTVHPFATAHVFCGISAWSNKLCCYKSQGILCAVFNHTGKGDLSNGYRNPKTKVG